MVSSEEFFQIAKTCKKLGALITIHCENGEIIE